MATVVYRNAVCLLNGADLSGTINEGPTIAFGAETLDETCHGDDTRINKGGLYTLTIDVGGNVELGSNGPEEVVAGNVGVDGVVMVVFPNGVTEGDTGQTKGYACLGVIDKFTIGGAVGSLLPYSFSVQSRGVAP